MLTSTECTGSVSTCE